MRTKKDWEAVATRWYSYSLAYTRAVPAVRAAASRQQRCWYSRIALLHPELGTKLDYLLAPLVIVRAIAYAGGPAKQRECAVELIAQLVEKRDRDRRVP